MVGEEEVTAEAEDLVLAKRGSIAEALAEASQS